MLLARRFASLTTGFSEDEGALNRGAVACLLAWRFAFLTAGCPENEGARNRRAVARSFLGPIRMTCGA
jgi:hypothetical protein